MRTSIRVPSVGSAAETDEEARASNSGTRRAARRSRGAGTPPRTSACVPTASQAAWRNAVSRPVKAIARRSRAGNDGLMAPNETVARTVAASQDRAQAAVDGRGKARWRPKKIVVTNSSPTRFATPARTTRASRGCGTAGALCNAPARAHQERANGSNLHGLRRFRAERNRARSPRPPVRTESILKACLDSGKERVRTGAHPDGPDRLATGAFSRRGRRRRGTAGRCRSPS